MTEDLTVSIRPATDSATLLVACEVRAAAYGLKSDEHRVSMATPDAVDLSPSTTVYLCERKVDGRAVGSMRVQLAFGKDDRLEIERYVGVNPSYAYRKRAEITRLSAIPGADPVVRLTLWKTAYLHARAHATSLIVVGARRPSLIRTYLGMGYREVCPPVPLPYAGGLEHTILAADLNEAEDYWRRVDHPMLDFTLRSHPEIQLRVPDSVENRPVHEVVRVLE